MRPVRRALAAIEDVLMIFAAASFIAIMVVMTLDVFLRYLFSSPLTWAFEVLTRYLMLSAFFFAVSYTLRLGEHLTVEVVYNRMPTKPRSLILGILYIFVTLIIAAIFWMSADTTLRSWRNGERLVGAVNWPVWTSHIIVALGMGVLTLRAGVTTISLFTSAATGVTLTTPDRPEEDAI